MQVTKEMVTLLNANQNGFAAVGLTYDDESGAFVVDAEGVDLTKLESLWDEAEADATKTKWVDLEVRQMVHFYKLSL